MGVDSGAEKEQGAGDQGMMFGYATNETRERMPLPIMLAHRIAERLAAVRKGLDGHPQIDWLRPDGKSQVSVEYEGDRPVAVRTVVVSTQHAERQRQPAAGARHHPRGRDRGGHQAGAREGRPGIPAAPSS